MANLFWDQPIRTLANSSLAVRLEQHPLWIIVTVAITSSLLVYLPFWSNGTFDVLYRYWDGPNYAYLAESLYSASQDHPLSAYNTPEYFAAHLPIYPLSIRLLSFFGYLNAMLITSVIYGSLAAVVLYKLLRETKTVANPLWSAIISLFIPARYLIYHSIGATEAPFIFFTLWSMLAYVRGQYLLCFALAGISGVVRITGILIGGAYFMMLVTEKKWKQIPLLGIVALPLLLTFTFYHFRYGDFFAYFGTNYSATNKLISFSPFDIFRIYSNNGEAHSAEFYLILHAIYGAGTALLWKKHRLFFWFSLITFVFSVFIFHQDVSRYLIPLAPLALIVAYDDIFSRPEFKAAFFPALFLVYFYTWGMLPHNVIDKNNFLKLERYLNNEAPEAIVQGTFDTLRIQSCAYGSCQSQIQKEGSNALNATRGLNVYAFTEDNQLFHLITYDHCIEKQALTHGDTLKTLIDTHADPIKKIILLSEDTAVCDYEPLQGVSRWSEGFKIKALQNIKFRDTYIAIIDVASGAAYEARDKGTIAFP